MDLVATKVVVLILLGLIKLVSGLIPLILDKVLQVKKVRLRLFLVYFIFAAQQLLRRSFALLDMRCRLFFDIYQVAYWLKFFMT